jgi:DNA-binding response OmpR family regulator
MNQTQQGGGEPTPSLRVLIVDDNRDVADSECAMLHLLGHDCRTAYEVHAALDEAQAFQPHVVLLDLGMPRNGFRIAEELRKRAQTFRPFIVAVTGYGDGDHRDRSERAGVDYYMLKPAEPEALAKLLGSLAFVVAKPGTSAGG